MHRQKKRKSVATNSVSPQSPKADPLEGKNNPQKKSHSKRHPNKRQKRMFEPNFIEQSEQKGKEKEKGEELSVASNEQPSLLEEIKILKDHLDRVESNPILDQLEEYKLKKLMLYQAIKQFNDFVSVRAQLTNPLVELTPEIMHVFTFVELIPEMIMYVFSFLHIRDLVNVRGVNKQFQAIAQDESLWKKINEKTKDLNVKHKKKVSLVKMENGFYSFFRFHKQNKDGYNNPLRALLLCIEQGDIDGVKKLLQANKITLKMLAKKDIKDKLKALTTKRKEIGHEIFKLAERSYGDSRTVDKKKGGSVLHWALLCGEDFEFIFSHFLIGKTKCHVDAASIFGTPLQIASEMGDVDAVRLLLGHKCGINATSSKNRTTAYNLAMENRHYEIALELLQYKASPEGYVNLSGEEAILSSRLQYAVHYGNFDFIQKFFEIFPDITPEEINDAIFNIKDDQEDVLSFLITKGADINSRDTVGMTPLIRAVYSKNAPLTKILLNHNADVFSKDSHGCNLMHYVSDIETLTVILEHLKKLLPIVGKHINKELFNQRNIHSETPLDLAIKRNEIGLVENLIQKTSVKLSNVDLNTIRKPQMRQMLKFSIQWRAFVQAINGDIQQGLFQSTTLSHLANAYKIDQTRFQTRVLCALKDRALNLSYPMFQQLIALEETRASFDFATLQECAKARGFELKDENAATPPSFSF